MTATAEREQAAIFQRPAAKTGIWSWVTTVDHKRIGIMYGYAAFLFFILGGIEALLIRLQLAQANNEFLTAGTYNAMFTMHGTTMIFLFIMPTSAAFMNYLVPLMIGARDVAFPRLNALTLWIFLFGGIFLYSTFIFGTSVPPTSADGTATGNLALGGGPGTLNGLAGSPDGGWFCYQPNCGPLYSPGTAMDFWALGIQLLGLASLISAVNFLVTIFNLRTRGLRLLRMPVFVWMSTVVSFLLLFSLPIIAVALFMVTFDRQFGSLFFAATNGGDPILWQHLFWLFGHPEVYILVLPAMGMVSEILPVFSGKPLFGYSAVVFAGAAIAFLGFGVWAHHMFASGITPMAQAAFGLATMTIAIPTGIKIFNWIATIWQGKIRLATSMLFAIGFVAMFTIGGLSGVTHAVVPSDWQQTDTYYIVAHFHYVLFGGSVFGLFGGIYYWFPKLTGRLMSEKLGKIHFWLMFIGFNLTFAPMHWLGLQGMVRRTWKYAPETGLQSWNLAATVGAFTIALSVAVFIFNWIISRRRGAESGIDPWDARTIEWMSPNPTPEYNFAEPPLVTRLDHFWHLKYDEDLEGRAARRPEAAQTLARIEHDQRNPKQPIQLPDHSYFPFFFALGLPLVFYGIIYHLTLWGKAMILVGAVISLTAVIGWALEPLEEHHTTPAGGDGEIVGAMADG
ncbi:MAG TPA: cytochrome c oxidase subunit I [Acidimicrobiia bacterium]|nr:cytochrome c oxidase subunit I [Acidimicrobiia bacterium]